MEGDAAMAEAVTANPKIEATRDGLYEYKVGSGQQRIAMAVHLQPMLRTQTAWSAV